MIKTINFFRFYTVGEILKSFLMSFLFFAIPASIVIIGGVQVILLMVPQMISVLAIMYALLLLILGFSTKILIETLQNYKVLDEINYDLLYKLIFVVIAAIITIIEVVVVFIF